MTIALLILAALILPATMLVLSISMNEFEKHTLALNAVLVKRCIYVPTKKSSTMGPGGAGSAAQLAPYAKNPGEKPR